MNLDAGEARRRFAAARVARLATVDAAGQPHLVPVTFALHDDVIVTAVDHKPKRSTALRRLANIAANPRVTLIADHYDEDWQTLWWARADGLARIIPAEAARAETIEDGATGDGSAGKKPAGESAAWHDAIDRLTAKYHQYQRHRPTGPVILIDVHHWSGWSYRPPP
ncbi:MULTISPECIES: TIGR03668 family PPOX class F420-dependent oxidoreductase [unclassified Frankia]|uniref:TIGR03668 family PPOX class F420-dependent oxidoreductase n=1 Tax=unclassified Frankia TaxID=2632575 RepID=UPI0020259765